jgi:endogenous inhibitor of DNA gyrase (YacG/DUF329 family)
MKYRCPICNKLFASSALEKTKEAKYFPFCSQRCKLLDLGAWLDSEYRIVSKISNSKNDEPGNATQD